MDFIFIRHGQSEDNLSRRMSRDFTGLTPCGVEQIKRTRELLEDYSFDTVYCSPLKRTMQTMEVLGLEGELEDRIREMNWGIFTGYTYDEYSNKYPVETAQWNKDPFSYTIPGGESIFKTYDRVKQFLDGLKSADQNVLSVTHEGIIRLACSWVVDDPETFFRFRAENGSITVISVVDGYKYIKQLNHR